MMDTEEKYKVVIIDDERSASDALRRELEPYREFEIKGIASSGAKGKKMIMELHPDLLFLDVELPAKVEGNIDCVNVDVQGMVVGDIQASGAVALKLPAKVMGNISSAVLSVEPGVVFNGTCQMQKKENREAVKE